MRVNDDNIVIVWLTIPLTFSWNLLITEIIHLSLPYSQCNSIEKRGNLVSWYIWVGGISSEWKKSYRYCLLSTQTLETLNTNICFVILVKN